MAFTDIEKRGLEVFVTSGDDQFYAVKNTLPIEVFGALGSFFSRNPKDFRAHLLDAVYGRIPGYESEGGEENLRKLAAGEFNPPHQAILSGLAKAQDFFKAFYGGYSHKSIANTVWIPMVGTHVSQLFAKELAYDQLAFFIEQSTRYVEFDGSKVQKDPKIMASGMRGVYEETLETLLRANRETTRDLIDHYKQQIPFEVWVERQDSKVRADTRSKQETKYTRELRAKAFDVSRYLLPQAIQTNIAWIVDARSLEFDIAGWKGHPLAELQEAAMAIERNAGQIAPSLLKYTGKNPYYADKLAGYDFEERKLRLELPFRSGSPHFGKGIDILEYNADGLDSVLAHVLKRHEHGSTFRECRERIGTMLFREKLAMLERIVANRERTDEKLEVDEEFDLVKMTVEIRSDVGAIRDLRRHQKNDRSEPLLTLASGYSTPATIQEMRPEVQERFREAIERATEGEAKVAQQFPFEAQYLVPMAANHTLTMSLGMDQLQYLVWTRSTPQGHFSYRQDAINLAEAATKVQPWLLGYQKYPEGKSFQEVYAAAPLKKLLRVQMTETGLHQ
ncbi:MAG: FAD-dependent thymidylate synthase [Nanoarchaeota archaeon]